MNNEYLNKAKQVIPDPQILSVVAAKRARQLATGARPMVKCDMTNMLDVALLGLLTYEFADEASDAAAAAPADAAPAAEETAKA